MFSVLRNTREAVWLEQSGQRERGKGNEFEDVARGLGKDLGFFFFFFPHTHTVFYFYKR